MSKPDKHDPAERTTGPEAGYEPPAAEDIDTTVEPAETASGSTSIGGSGGRTLGVEESDQWH